MDAAAANASVATGIRLLTRAGFVPRGFVAPDARAPERAGAQLRMVGHAAAARAGDGSHVSALSLRHSALGIRAGALASRGLLRDDLYPSDF